MKWKHKLVEIAFRNYNSYVYHDDSLEARLTRERAQVSESRNIFFLIFLVKYGEL